MSILTAFDASSKSVNNRFMMDGALSPDFDSAPEGYFRFSVVRNPWERFISGWKFCDSTRNKSLYEVLTNLPQEGYDYRHITRPQHAILYDKDGRLVVDYIMRFETLQQDFDHVCDTIGKPRCILPHVNRGADKDFSKQSRYRKLLRRVISRANSASTENKQSEKKHYSEYFDEQTQQLFMDHFGKDVELFNYRY
jgi:hypothetical protein